MTAGEHRLLVRVDERRYLLPVAAVVELLPVPSCSPVPGAPDWLLGVCSLHGELTAAVDLARFLELPAAAPPTLCLLFDRKVAALALLVSGVEQLVVTDDPAATPIDPQTLLSRLETAMTALLQPVAEKGRG
jgi:chemotaxis signal transduction protein